MKEQLISFETAKLAKKRRVDIEVKNHFTVEKDDSVLTWYSEIPYNWNQYKNNHEFSRPTQSLLQTWLREVHNIYVLVDMGINRTYHWKYFDDTNAFTYPKGTYEKYELALEAGLQEALKLI